MLQKDGKTKEDMVAWAEKRLGEEDGDQGRSYGWWGRRRGGPVKPAPAQLRI